MQAHRVAKLVGRTRLAHQWPEFTAVLLSDSGEALARAVAIPYSSKIDGREAFPDGGWEQAVVWATEDFLDHHEPDTLCALEIAVHPDHQRRGLSALALEAMLANASAHGFSRLIAPVRPPMKAADPWTSMEDYASRTRGDGLPADPWLRVHTRVGGRIRGIAKTSAVITADLQRWREWVGLPLDVDGRYAIPAGLVPLIVSTELGIGAYIEPNVWVEHDPAGHSGSLR